jgi:tetratricopeptide (TPR) repeat protein
MKSRIEIKQMIAAKPKEALEYLESLVDQQKNTEITNVLILIQSELNEIEQMNLSGTSSYDEYRRGMNRINLNILKIVDDLPDGYFETVQDKKSAKDTHYEIDQTRMQVSTLIRDLVDIGIQDVNYANPTISGFLNSKRHIITNQVVRLVEKSGLSISGAEYLVIANALHSLMDNVKAEQFFKRAIENIDEYTDSAISKINVIRSYADFLYRINRAADGAKQYATALVQGTMDEDYLINGYTYQMKFYNEADIQNYGIAIEDYKMAKSFYQQVGNSMVRNYNLNALENTWNSKNIPATYSRP